MELKGERSVEALDTVTTRRPMADDDALSAALAGSQLKDFNVLRKIGGKDVAPGAMAMTITMHGVCSYVYTVTSRRPAASNRPCTRSIWSPGKALRMRSADSLAARRSDFSDSSTSG